MNTRHYWCDDDVNLFDLLERASAVLNPLRRRLDATHLVTTAVACVDQALACGQDPSDVPLRDAVFAWGGYQDKLPAGHVMKDPHGLTVTITRDPHTQTLLLAAHTKAPDLADALETVTGLRVAPPADGSQKAREDAHPPVLTWTHGDPTGSSALDLLLSGDDEALLGAMPDRGTRARQLAQRLLLLAATELDNPAISTLTGMLYPRETYPGVVDAAAAVLTDVGVPQLMGRAAITVPVAQKLARDPLHQAVAQAVATLRPGPGERS